METSLCVCFTYCRYSTNSNTINSGKGHTAPFGVTHLRQICSHSQTKTERKREFLLWFSVLSSEEGSSFVNFKPGFQLWLWQILDHPSSKFSKHFILLYGYNVQNLLLLLVAADLLIYIELLRLHFTLSVKLKPVLTICQKYFVLEILDLQAQKFRYDCSGSAAAAPNQTMVHRLHMATQN